MNLVDQHRRDTYDAIGFCDFIQKRNFTYQGEEVNPTSKQLSELRNLSDLFTKNCGDSSLATFDLIGVPRILIANTILFEVEFLKRESTGTRCHMFLFNDIILLAKGRSLNEKYEIMNILYIKKLRIQNFHYDDDEDPLTFEIHEGSYFYNQ